MKKLLLLVVGIFGLFWSAASTTSQSGRTDVLCRTLPDSLYPIIKNCPLIFYSYGHYGYSWSIIARGDSGFRAFSGKVEYGGDIVVSDPAQSVPFDSALLFSANKELLTWALDTMPTEGIKMKKIGREVYATFYNDLSVFDSDWINVFSSDDAVKFSGPDSLQFNKKFHKLRLIMWWISFPEIRQYIPESEIF